MQTGISTATAFADLLLLAHDGSVTVAFGFGERVHDGPAVYLEPRSETIYGMAAGGDFNGDSSADFAVYGYGTTARTYFVDTVLSTSSASNWQSDAIYVATISVPALPSTPWPSAT